MNFADVKEITIPEGSVKKITASDITLWQKVMGVLQMLNPATVPDENAFISRANGNTVPPSATGGEFRHSDYIEIEAGEEYYFGLVISSASTAGLAWYDGRKSYISGMNLTALGRNDNVATAPDGAKYVRFCWRLDEFNPNWETTVWLCKNHVCNHWTPYFIVPDEYQLLLYIQSSGTQYIDTGITINYALQKIEQRAIAQYTTSNSNRELMGANGYGFWGKNASDKLESAVGATSVTITESALVKNSVSLTTNPQGRGVLFTVNETQYSATASTLANNNYAVYVFAIGGRSGAAASFFGKARVYEYEILLNDEVVSHLVPVKRRSDGVLGMYDLISDQFHANAGTGVFIAGTVLE